MVERHHDGLGDTVSTLLEILAKVMDVSVSELVRLAVVSTLLEILDCFEPGRGWYAVSQQPFQPSLRFWAVREWLRTSPKLYHVSTLLEILVGCMQTSTLR